MRFVCNSIHAACQLLDLSPETYFSWDISQDSHRAETFAKLNKESLHVYYLQVSDMMLKRDKATGAN